ncbi:MAG: glycosyltransferase family 2 protein, partial [Burkholderiaceae bacterium]
LADAIQSVVVQTLRDWELIVVDDASVPAVDAACCGNGGDRVRVLRNGRSLGGAGSKAAGAGSARGAFIAFLDDDDMYAPDLLERALTAFQSHPDVDVLFLGVHWFGRDAATSASEQAESMQRVVSRAPPREEGDLLFFGERLFEALLHAMPMDFQRVIVRRTAFERIGPHRKECLMWDCDWALRAVLSARCALLRPGLYRQRTDGQEYYSKPGRERAQLESALEMTLRLREQPPAGTSARSLDLLRAAASRHAGSLAYFHAQHGPLSSSLAAWWRSLRLQPGVASPRVPLSALAHAARRRWRQEPVPR